MQLVVTGGAGFIGAHFVRHALDAAADVRVTNLDALTYAGDRARLAGLDDTDRHRFVHGDVRDVALVSELVADADAVVHLAAGSHVDRSIDDPVPFLETNVVGTGVVLDACRRHDIPRVLVVSTDEVYGSVPTGAATEDTALAPNSPYAASKASADLLARAYRTTYGLPVLVIRPANTFGPWQLPEKLIPLFVTNLLDGEPVPLYGDGGNVRDWLHVADTVAGLWRVLLDGEPGEAYNVAAGNLRTNHELTMALLSRFGLQGEQAAARIHHVPDRPGHDRRYAADAARVRALGWSPRRSLEDGLDATIDWYRRNVPWWRACKDAGLTRRRGAGPA